MEPGARWKFEPWAPGPPPKPWRLMDAGKPGAFAGAADVDVVADVEQVGLHFVTGFEFVSPAIGNSRSVALRVDARTF